MVIRQFRFKLKFRFKLEASYTGFVTKGNGYVSKVVVVFSSLLRIQSKYFHFVEALRGLIICYVNLLL